MDRTRIPRWALELKFKRMRPIGQSRTRWFSQVLEASRREESLARN
jgi:hypothetical protein